MGAVHFPASSQLIGKSVVICTDFVNYHCNFRSGELLRVGSRESFLQLSGGVGQTRKNSRRLPEIFEQVQIR